MENLKRYLFVPACVVLSFFAFTASAAAQDRPRVIGSVSSRPVNQPPATVPAQTQPSSVTRSVSQRPVLTTEPMVQPPVSLVKRTGESSPVAAANKMLARRSVFSNSVTDDVMTGIQKRIGIPYLLGSEGPNRYDCSGFVWAVFGDAGINFERTSARQIWNMSIPVTGDERYKFGTLVFMNNLGHMGIVADEEGFYHASSSKGVTYSKFEGYWAKRIVGFRRLVAGPAEAPAEEVLAR